MATIHHPHRTVVTPEQAAREHGVDAMTPREADALGRSGFRIDLYEALLKRESAGTSSVAPCGRGADLLYTATLWTAVAVLVVSIVLWVVPS